MPELLPPFEHLLNSPSHGVWNQGYDERWLLASILVVVETRVVKSRTFDSEFGQQEMQEQNETSHFTYLRVENV